MSESDSRRPLTRAASRSASVRQREGGPPNDVEEPPTTRRRTGSSPGRSIDTVVAQIASLTESVAVLRRQMAGNVVASTQAVPAGRDSVELGEGPTPAITVETAHKIWSRSLETVRISRIGDTRFPTARKTWQRLRRDFPVSSAVERRLIGLAFEGTAQLVFEEVAAENLGAGAEDLWNLLAKRLYNASQQRAHSAKFLTTFWRERKESIETYATRLRAAALSLPENVSEEMLTHRFIEGLPLRVRSQALAVQGSFDEIVGRVALIAESAGPAVERVRNVRETAALDASQSASPPGQQKRSNGAAAGRWKERICYRCRRPGHIARFCSEARETASARNARGAPLSGKGGAPPTY